MAKKTSSHHDDEHELRYDPGNLMGLDFHAARALGRKTKNGEPEFEGLLYDEARAAIEKAAFRNTEAHAGEAERLRARMLVLLDIRFQKRTPEQIELLKKLFAQVDTAVELEYPEKPKKGFPTKETMKAKAQEWLQNLPPKVMNGILKFCPKNAQFQVVRPEKVPDLLNDTPHQIYWEDGWNDVQAGTWKFAITDGREDLPFEPNIYYEKPDKSDEREKRPRTNEAMVAEYRKMYEAEGLTLMPQYGYVPAQRRALTQKRVLDREYFSAFPRRAGADWLPCAGWDDDHVNLGDGDPDNSLENLRGRFWVEGEMSA